MIRAISSFPVPLSPWMSTVARLAATRPTALNSCCIGGDAPTRSSSFTARRASTEGKSVPPHRRRQSEARASPRGSARADDAIAGLVEMHREELADGAVVVDDEDSFHLGLGLRLATCGGGSRRLSPASRKPQTANRSLTDHPPNVTEMTLPRRCV